MCIVFVVKANVLAQERILCFIHFAICFNDIVKNNHNHFISFKEFLGKKTNKQSNSCKETVLMVMTPLLYNFSSLLWHAQYQLLDENLNKGDSILPYQCSELISL